jgi:hypothetical protein
MKLTGRRLPWLPVLLAGKIVEKKNRTGAMERLGARRRAPKGQIWKKEFPGETLR